jgi:hypothetical protein
MCTKYTKWSKEKMKMLQLEAVRKELKLNHPLHKLKSKMIQLQMFVSLSVTKLI